MCVTLKRSIKVVAVAAAATFPIRDTTHTELTPHSLPVTKSRLPRVMDWACCICSISPAYSSGKALMMPKRMSVEFMVSRKSNWTVGSCRAAAFCIPVFFYSCLYICLIVVVNTRFFLWIRSKNLLKSIAWRLNKRRINTLTMQDRFLTKKLPVFRRFLIHKAIRGYP